jgi:hypothetical protein
VFDPFDIENNRTMQTNDMHRQVDLRQLINCPLSRLRNNRYCFSSLFMCSCVCMCVFLCHNKFHCFMLLFNEGKNHKYTNWFRPHRFKTCRSYTPMRLIEYCLLSHENHIEYILVCIRYKCLMDICQSSIAYEYEIIFFRVQLISYSFGNIQQRRRHAPM